MLKVVFGGQFGSEGKGLLASWLAANENYRQSITDAGPNAGHTAVLEDGTTVVTFHLPMTGVLNKDADIILSGGAIIDPDILRAEIDTMDHLGFNVSDRLYIHPKAAIIQPQHKDEEKAEHSAVRNISSTMKGVGIAAAHKIMRTGITAAQHPFTQQFTRNGLEFMIEPENAIVEVAQGFSLGSNTPFYPYSTHRVCTPAQGLMNAGIPTTVEHEVYACLRMWPIRVGSLPGTTSGSVYPDQEETTWEKLGLEPQYTTVTNRMRRVFTFSRMQVQDMVKQTKPDHIFLNFCNHAPQELVVSVADNIVSAYHNIWGEAPNMLYGYGPKASDIKWEIQ